MSTIAKFILWVALIVLLVSGGAVYYKKRENGKMTATDQLIEEQRRLLEQYQMPEVSLPEKPDTWGLKDQSQIEQQKKIYREIQSQKTIWDAVKKEHELKTDQMEAKLFTDWEKQRLKTGGTCASELDMKQQEEALPFTLDNDITSLIYEDAQKFCKNIPNVQTYEAILLGNIVDYTGIEDESLEKVTLSMSNQYKEGGSAACAVIVNEMIETVKNYPDINMHNRFFLTAMVRIGSKKHKDSLARFSDDMIMKHNPSFSGYDNFFARGSDDNINAYLLKHLYPHGFQRKLAFIQNGFETWFAYFKQPNETYVFDSHTRSFATVTIPYAYVIEFTDVVAAMKWITSNNLLMQNPENLNLYQQMRLGLTMTFIDLDPH